MENNNTCVWVKASERKPPEGWEGVTRVGKSADNSFYKNGEFRERDIVGMPYAPDYQKEIEWLDESPQQSAPAQIGEVKSAEEIAYEFYSKAAIKEDFKPLSFEKFKRLNTDWTFSAMEAYAAQFKGQSLSKDLEQGDKMEVLEKVISIVLKTWFPEKVQSDELAKSLFDAAKDHNPGLRPLITQLFSNSQPVSDELQLLRKRLEAAESVLSFVPVPEDCSYYRKGFREALNNWQQLKHQSK